MAHQKKTRAETQQNSFCKSGKKDSVAKLVGASNRKPITAIDLFAGIGGIRLGFEKAFTYRSKTYLDTVAVCEINEDSIRTYVNHFGDTDKDAICRDIHDFNLKDVGHVDICLAGFPCQAFSMAGCRRGTDDERGRLFYEIIRLCDSDDKPDIIFCENVRGLLSMHPPLKLDKNTGYRIGCLFSDMLDKLRGAGYEPFYKILNSKDFGVPQNRERLYIVAFNRGAFSEIDFRFPVGRCPIKTLEDVWDEHPTPDLYLSKQYLDTLKRHKERHVKLNHGFGYVVKCKSDIANTLMCGGMGRERNLLFDPNEDLPDQNSNGKSINKEIRVMSPLEWERLQGFPPGYTDSVCKTKRYEQLGNSVTVPVVEAIAKEIRKIIESREDRIRVRHNCL